MSIITRLLQSIDGRLETVLDRHLSIALPEQRRSESVRRIDVWPCCPCCEFCGETHRDACPDCQDGAA